MRTDKVSDAAWVLRELIRSAPEIAQTVRDFAGAKGIDLGPVPPGDDSFARIDAAIDAELRRKE